MPKLKKVVKVTQAQYNTLASGGTVGSYTGLDANYIYLVVDDNNYNINSTYAYDSDDDEWKRVADWYSEGSNGTEICLIGHLQINGDDDDLNANKPNDETGGSDLDITIFNTGIYMNDGSNEYKISFPAKDGVFAVDSDLPQVKRYI